MKTLVTFYSKTGNTKKVGKEIAKNLNTDIDEIVDEKKRKGFSGFLSAVKDVMFKKSTVIATKRDLSEYDLIIIGTPVWAGTITPAIRTYLSTNQFNNLAFFCTYAGNEGKSFTEMENLSKKPIAVLGLKDKEIADSKEKIKEFCESLK